MTTQARAAGGTLALLGGRPAGAPAPDPHPVFAPEAIRRVAELLRTGDAVGLSKLHPAIGEAEEAIARRHGVSRCLGTSSGHAALHAALIGLEVTGGDEVITTPYTYGSSISPILHNGAVPVFADVERETGLLDPTALEAALTPRTRAILPVHLYGQPADMTAIRRFADAHGLAVVEDGSQAHGALHRGREVGAFGDAAGFSCMGGKLLAATEAGYLLTARADVYWKAALGTQHLSGAGPIPGRAAEEGFPEALRPYVDSLTYTYRLSVLDAVLLVEQLRTLDERNEGRRANVAAFRAALEGVGSVSFPAYREGDVPAYHMLTMNFVPEHAGIARETYLAALRAEGVPLILSYVRSPIHTWLRLDPDSGAPRSLWDETLRRSGRRYRELELPGCAWKVSRSLELVWNYVEPVPERMEQLAEAFRKVERQLPALRRYERSTA